MTEEIRFQDLILRLSEAAAKKTDLAYTAAESVVLLEGFAEMATTVNTAAAVVEQAEAELAVARESKRSLWRPRS